jgi:hypothetical protein
VKRYRDLALPFPGISQEDRERAAAPAPDVPTRVDRWRRENPDAFRTWTTKHGCVVQFWGMRVYYGICRDCPGLVTDRRSISGADANRFKTGPTQLGRWPMLCDDCRERRYEDHAAAARYRMARLRRDRYAFRDEQYARFNTARAERGQPELRVGQGIPGPEAYERAAKRAEGDWVDEG